MKVNMILLMPNLLYYCKVCFPIYSTICGCVCVLVYCDHIVYARLGCKKSIHIIHCCTFLLSLTFNSIDDTRLLAHAHKWQMLITCLCLNYNIIYTNWCCGILKIFQFIGYMRQDPDRYLIISSIDALVYSYRFI